MDYAGLAASLLSDDIDYLLRRAADHRREAKIARAEGDEDIAKIFEVGARKFERLAEKWIERESISLRNVWPP
jgi:hypothetical protein